MSAPLRVTYLLEDTTLFGGVKVVLRQAEGLAALGHDVSILTKGADPKWTRVGVPLTRVPELLPEHVRDCDVVVATFWTTIATAAAVADAGRARALHYCQGIELDYTHNVAEHPRIEEAYRRALPAMVVSPHLGERLRARYGRPSRTVPPPLEPIFRPRPRLGPARVPRVLVVSPIEIDWKGAATALAALERLAGSGRALRTVRVSQWPPPAEELALDLDVERHVHVPPAAVAQLMAGADLLLAPSWPAEGFGLPVLEAMGCGLPVVASDVPCFRGYAAGAAALVPMLDVDAFAREAERLLGSRLAWWRARRAGLATARRFAPERIARDAEAAMRWAASDARAS